MSMRKRKRIILLAATIIFLSVFIVWVIWGNTALEINRYTLESDTLPKGFYGFRIAQISDLHNAEFGENNKKLISMLKSAVPDIIAITGDLIDSGSTDDEVEITLAFAETAMEIAPCYYVTGNHDARKSEDIYSAFESRLLEISVVVLHDSEMIFERNGEKFRL